MIAIVLAAGLGTRMRSRRAKVLHPLLGRPLGAWPVAAARAAGLDVVVVVHHQEEAVRAALAGERVRFARQAAPRGTGDAVRAALDRLPERGTALVLPGDAPLVRPDTLRRLLAAHEAAGAAASALAVRVADPAGYGRIVRDAAGRPVGIVEEAELAEEQRALREVNSGVLALDLAWARGALARLEPHPPKGELYLTDLLGMAAEEGRALAPLHDGPADELAGVNDRWALARAARALRDRILRAHALAGATFLDPETTWVEADVRVGTDVEIGPGVQLLGSTRIGPGTAIGAGCVLRDAEIGEGARVEPYSVLEEARVGPGARVGPFARLRPGAVLEEGARVGNFVEVKKAVIGRGAKANHLAYIGDASVGAGANVGAGTITCNYDGFAKHRTEIGERAFIGSNAALVAPVRVGAGAVVGAGSVVVEDVPDDALAVARGRQRNIEGGARRYRARRSGERA